TLSAAEINPFLSRLPHICVIKAWTFINASGPTLLAHLDEGLYNDFYGLWVTLIVINCLIFLVGMVLNTVALYVIYTINLAVTDLMVNLSLPTRILLYYSGGACLTCSYMHIFSYFVNMYCSIVFLTCICVDRYLVIVQVSGVSTVVSCCCCFVFAGGSIWSHTPPYRLLSKNTGCCIAKLLILTITEFFLPYIIILVFTLRIMWALIDWRLMKQSRERRQKAVQLLATVLVIFTICFTPFHVRQVWVYFYPDMPSLNSCMDPIVYCFITNNFQVRPYSFSFFVISCSNMECVMQHISGLVSHTIV
uniref:G protein-coupled receptor 20 n=1 Tax=Oryzias latipes TaxID=8090 RepID=A0A3B3IEK5_ORYLA